MPHPTRAARQPGGRGAAAVPRPRRARAAPGGRSTRGTSARGTRRGPDRLSLLSDGDYLRREVDVLPTEPARLPEPQPCAGDEMDDRCEPCRRALLVLLSEPGGEPLERRPVPRVDLPTITSMPWGCSVRPSTARPPRCECGPPSPCSTQPSVPATTRSRNGSTPWSDEWRRGRDGPPPSRDRPHGRRPADPSRGSGPACTRTRRANRGRDARRDPRSR